MVFHPLPLGTRETGRDRKRAETSATKVHCGSDLRRATLCPAVRIHCFADKRPTGLQSKVALLASLSLSTLGVHLPVIQVDKFGVW